MGSVSPVQIRPATLDDVAVICALQARWDTVWFGAPEESEDEARERMQRVTDFAEQTRLLFDGDRLLGSAIWWESETWLCVDPDIDPAPLYADLLPWLGSHGPREVDVLDRDQVRRDALTAAGWHHGHSSFDLLRPVTPEWELATPTWPEGVHVRDLAADDGPAVHHLIYDDAEWAAVPGHPHRDYEQWHSIFITPATLPEQQVLAWRGDRLIGGAIGRTWDDGTGWVSQLAVAVDERGQGLARAMLLDALRRWRDTGATALGLSVMAENRGALRLYIDTGLAIDREWMTWKPADDS